MKIFFNNVKCIIAYGITACVSMMLIYAIHMVYSLPQGSILQTFAPMLASTASAFTANMHIIEVGMTWFLVFVYMFRGLLLKDSGSILKNGFSVIALPILLLIFELIARAVHVTGFMSVILTGANAPLYFMFMSANNSFHSAPLWFVAVPACLMYMGLLVRRAMISGVNRIILFFHHRRSDAAMAE